MPTTFPKWDDAAEKQRETLQDAGVVASDAGAIAALLAARRQVGPGEAGAARSR